MAIYSDFCQYIRNSLFSEDLKGEFVSFVIDDEFINDACKSLHTDNSGLFRSVSQFMFGNLSSVFQNTPCLCFGVVVVQLFTAYLRGGDEMDNSGYRSALADLLNIELIDLEKWFANYQEFLWTSFYNWCEKNDYRIIQVEKSRGTWRYVRYIISNTKNTLNQNDLKSFGYDFYIHGLLPHESLTEVDFWRVIGDKEKLLYRNWHTMRSQRILNDSDSNAFSQIYTYYSYRWNGEYQVPEENNGSRVVPAFKFRLFLSREKERLDIRNENFDRVDQINLQDLIKEKLQLYWHEKHKDMIVFQPNDNYQDYWEETRYIDNSDIGLVLIPNSCYGLFLHEVITTYQNYKLVSIKKSHSTRQFFASEKKPFQLEGGLKIGLRCYLKDGEPMLRIFKSTKFWINSNSYEKEEASLIKLNFPEGKNTIKFMGYNPITVYIQGGRNNDLKEWSPTYKKWYIQSNLDCFAIEPRHTGEDTNTFVGMDFQHVQLQTLTQTKPILERWIMAHHNKIEQGETNPIIKQLQMIKFI